jgi:hypothetical protein
MMRASRGQVASIAYQAAAGSSSSSEREDTTGVELERSTARQLDPENTRVRDAGMAL